MKELFDKVSYGVRLRVERRKQGYRKGEDFCEDVKKQTGLDINAGVLYRIEQGKQAPTVDQILAFNFVLRTEVLLTHDLNTTVNLVPVVLYATPVSFPVTRW